MVYRLFRIPKDCTRKQQASCWKMSVGCDAVSVMSQSAILHARIDLETKAARERILAALSLTRTEAICLFYRQIAIRKEFPVELRVPNALRESVLEMSENDKMWDT